MTHSIDAIESLRRDGHAMLGDLGRDFLQQPWSKHPLLDALASACFERTSPAPVYWHRDESAPVKEWHRDHVKWRRDWSAPAVLRHGDDALIIVIVAVCAFSKANGATEIVPRSHYEPARIERPDDLAIVAEMPLGHAVAFVGSHVLHRTGPGCSVSSARPSFRLTTRGRWRDATGGVPHVEHRGETP